jgi:ATP-binding cassette subfamily B protein
MERVGELLDARPGVAAPTHPIRCRSRRAASGLRGVTFAYPGRPTCRR